MKFTNEQIIQLKQLVNQHGGYRSAKPHIRAIIDFDFTAQDVFDAVMDVSPTDRVAPCGKEKKFDGFHGGYRFCGSLKVCACAVKNTKEKSEETNLIRYGSRRPLGNEEIKLRAQATSMERYGSHSPLGNSDIRQKGTDTLIERFGVDNPSKSEEILEKTRQTVLDRYGTECSLSNEAVRAKSIETSMARYGVRYPVQSQMSKTKTIEANRERYGVDHHFQSEDFKRKNREYLENHGVDHISHIPEVKERIRATNMERHGAATPFESQAIRERAIKAPRDHEARQRLIVERYGRSGSALRITPEAYDIVSNADKLLAFSEGKSLPEVATELGLSPSTVAKRWKKMGLPSTVSRYEIAMEEWLTQEGIRFRRGDRKILSGWELDFFLVDHNIGIEINGIYWHSDRFKSPTYHRDKLSRAVAAGVRLLSVNEDEIISRNDLIRGKILNLIGRSPRGVAARKLRMGVLSGREANDFFDNYHIQGRTGTLSWAIGAWDDGKLVGAMAFNRQRGSGMIELIRFCSSGKTHAGMFSRMFKAAIREFGFDAVVSFADLRYSEGAVYEGNGFIHVGTIPPDYRYVRGQNTFHKSSFTRAKIEKKFGITLGETTERQAMSDMGYLRIYDCGKKKYLWTAE